MPTRPPHYVSSQEFRNPHFGFTRYAQMRKTNPIPAQAFHKTNPIYHPNSQKTRNEPNLPYRRPPKDRNAQNKPNPRPSQANPAGQRPVPARRETQFTPQRTSGRPKKRNEPNFCRNPQSTFYNIQSNGPIPTQPRRSLWKERLFYRMPLRRCLFLCVWRWRSMLWVCAWRPSVL